MKSILVLLRHGQSTWNEQNKFTGFVDVDLSEKGIKEAQEAQKLLLPFSFDYLFSSALKRAQETAKIVLDKKSNDLKTIYDAALNERHYGDLQGINKDIARQKFGEEQIKTWRRGFSDAPPNGESLKDTYNRVVPFYKNNILPLLKNGKNIIVVAHGNSLRSLVMSLENISEDLISNVEIPTCEPIIYYLEDGKVISKKILKKS